MSVYKHNVEHLLESIAGDQDEPENQQSNANVSCATGKWSLLSMHDQTQQTPSETRVDGSGKWSLLSMLDEPPKKGNYDVRMPVKEHAPVANKPEVVDRSDSKSNEKKTASVQNVLARLAGSDKQQSSSLHSDSHGRPSGSLFDRFRR